jgi:hypothetical protein
MSQRKITSRLFRYQSLSAGVCRILSFETLEKKTWIGAAPAEF